VPIPKGDSDYKVSRMQIRAFLLHEKVTQITYYEWQTWTIQRKLPLLHTPPCKHAACTSSAQMLVNMLKQKGGIQDAYASESCD
jgi:hypothetical protein